MPLIRTAHADEHEAIFMMGFDTWGEGQSEEDYLALCLGSPKYDQGQWYVMEVEGELVSSLIVYRAGFNLLPGCWGIGSVATPPDQQKKGYASSMVSSIVEEARGADARGLYLFSDIDLAFYEKFGFARVKASQERGQSPCMVLAFSDDEELDQALPWFF